MDLDQKWKVILEHYGVRPFRDKKTGEVRRPSTKSIEILYEEKLKLDQTWLEFKERRDLNVEAFLEWDFQERRPFRG